MEKFSWPRTRGLKKKFFFFPLDFSRREDYMFRSFNVIGSDAEEKPESEELKKIGAARRNCLVVRRREAEPKVEIMRVNLKETGTIEGIQH